VLVHMIPSFNGILMTNHTEEQLKILFSPGLIWVNFYNLTTLNQNLNRNIRYHLTFFLEFQFVFLAFSKFLLYFTGIYNFAIRSDVLKSLFRVEMEIRN
jgi:hypothetical protein